MKLPTHFIVTAHAQHRAAERRISREQFKEAVTKPDSRKKQYHGNHGGIVYLYKKRMPEGELNIVAEVAKDECYFITGYWK